MISEDYKGIQLKVGLEVHQQLSTHTKLFCSCLPFAGEELEGLSNETNTFHRILRPASSELGELDEAAEFESRHMIRVRYIASRSQTCLVEADEEPPHPISTEALETALLFALTLKSRIADEIHVMRKIVVDGSNTSGFQRTAIIALGGELDFGSGKVKVQTIGLEEDAGRAVKLQGESEHERTYALDRLGTPLVEVALAPLEGSPEDVENAARTLGRLLRATRRVARGLGTIRQDLNISILNGKVIEVKGVQRLDQIRKVVLFEASRQKFFYDLAGEIRQRLGALEVQSLDATKIFEKSNSTVIRRALSLPDGGVECILIRGFAGLLGKENEFHSRLGKELSAVAQTYGLGGVFHSDELPNYGITVEEINSLRSGNKMSPRDAFVLIAGKRDTTYKVREALKKRLQQAVDGVPAETRAANLEGETTFLRPRPGAARMYPETDIPLIEVSPNMLDRLKNEIPEPWDKQVATFSKEYALPYQLAEPMFDSDRRDLFERVVGNTDIPAGYVAYILVDTFLALSREEVAIDNLKDEVLYELFSTLAQGKFAKEAVPRVLRTIADNPTLSVNSALAKEGLQAINEPELTRLIEEVIEQNRELVNSRGTGAHSILMGKVMQKVRGKVDGKTVNDALAKRLELLSREKINQ